MKKSVFGTSPVLIVIAMLCVVVAADAQTSSQPAYIKFRTIVARHPELAQRTADYLAKDGFTNVAVVPAQDPEGHLLVLVGPFTSRIDFDRACDQLKAAGDGVDDATPYFTLQTSATGPQPSGSANDDARPSNASGSNRGLPTAAESARWINDFLVEKGGIAASEITFSTGIVEQPGAKVQFDDEGMILNDHDEQLGEKWYGIVWSEVRSVTLLSNGSIDIWVMTHDMFKNNVTHQTAEMNAFPAHFRFVVRNANIEDMRRMSNAVSRLAQVSGATYKPNTTF